MKFKSLLLYPFLFLFTAGCSSDLEEINPIASVNNGTVVKVNAPGFSSGICSKSIIEKDGTFSWVAGDEIGIYSNKIGGLSQNQSQISLVLSAGEGESTAYTSTTGWSLVPGGDYSYLSYYPYSEDNMRDKINLDYTGQVQTSNDNLSGLGLFDYMYADPAIPTFTGTANFTYHHIGSLVNIKVLVPTEYRSSIFYRIKLTAESSIFCTSGTYSIESILAQNGVPAIITNNSCSLSISFGDKGICPDKDGIISTWLMMYPINWSGQTISVKLYKDLTAASTTIGSFTPSEAISAGKKYVFTITNSVATGQNLPDKPLNDETLHILLFGHSFGEDCTQYLPAIAKAAGITDVHYGRWYQANCSIKQHLGHYTADDFYLYEEVFPDDDEWYPRNRRIKDVLKQYPWDIVIFQTNTGFEGEGNYNSYKDDFQTLRTYVINDCISAHGKAPIVGWNMFWGFNTGAYKDYDRNATEMYEAIVSATDAMSTDTGINLIIPVGTAMQNARNALDPTWGTVSQMQLLTDDGYHASAGIGRYVAGCTWFQYLIAPIYDTSINGNTYRPKGYSFDNDVVDDTKALTLQQCAVNACVNPFEPTPF